MPEIISKIGTAVFESLFFMGDPGKRVYWLYLLTSAGIACIVLICQKKQIVPAIKKATSPSLWLSRSSRVDFQWLIINHSLSILLIIPLIGGQISFALSLNQILTAYFGEGNLLAWSPISVSVTFTLSYFLLEDFSRFFWHYLLHKIPWLWRFHAIHHSANVLTPITLYRIHPFEMTLNYCRSVLVAGTLSGIFIYLFNNRISLIDILGVNIFGFLFNLAGANLRHSSVWLGFGKLENVLISPAQHQIHHSTKPKHFDKNMGATLAIWDRLFGTLLLSKHEQVDHFGLGGKNKIQQTISGQILGLKTRSWKNSPGDKSFDSIIDLASNSR